ncbi:MAG: molybdopterin molybdotransferase MoeA [Methylovulum sp.]|nr:molybdopterin molybdotransferase MoeA [Methylovulum sp.]
MDLCSQERKPLLSLAEALANISAAIQPVNESENLALKNALGRVLSAAVHAPINIPYDRNAAMDGYACASAELTGQPVTLTLAGTSWAGRPFQGALQAGQCARIFTGAVVPAGADTVIMQEQVQADGESIRFPANLKPLQNVRAAGEDVKQGQVVCAYPKKLSAVDLGLLASAGIADIPVKRQLKIAFFSTGDELAALGEPLVSGKLYDSNRYLLNGLLADPCHAVVDGGVIADDPKQLEDTLRAAAENCDVLITTGGASVGDADYVKDVLARCGQVNFWKIAIKPGKPLAFGTIGGCYFFGLPGNPAAVMTTFQQLVAPALRQLSGAPALHPLRLAATCTSALKKSPGRLEFQRGNLSQNADGELLVASAGKQGSHILSSLSEANCFIVLPSECAGISPGEQVTVEPFNV